MSPLEVAAILALTGWAIYKQTRVAEVTGANRFKLAIIYAIVGLAVGGFDLPSGSAGYAMIAAGLLLSLVVGLLRGRLTPIWVADDGRVLRRGTAVTVGLFVGLIVAKFALGTLAYFWHIDDGAGFGEVLIMIAIMVAVQAELVYRRSLSLRAEADAQSDAQSDTQSDTQSDAQSDAESAAVSAPEAGSAPAPSYGPARSAGDR